MHLFSSHFRKWKIYNCKYELTRTDRYVILYLQNSHQSNSVKNRLDKSFKAQEVQVLTIPRVLTIKYGMAFGKMACFCG